MRILAPMLAAVADAVERDDYIRRLARSLGVGEQAVKENVDRQKTKKPVFANAPSGANADDSPDRQWWELLALLIIAPEKIKDVHAVLGGKLGESKMALIYETLFEWYDNHGSKNIKVNVGTVIPKDRIKFIQSLVAELENALPDSDAIAHDIDERLKRIDERRREKMKGDFAAQIASAEVKGDMALVKELVKQLQEKTK